MANLVKGVWELGQSGDDLGLAANTEHETEKLCDRIMILPHPETDSSVSCPSPWFATITLDTGEHMVQLPCLLNWDHPQEFAIALPKVPFWDENASAYVDANAKFAFVIFDSAEGLEIAPLREQIKWDTEGTVKYGV